MNKLHEFRNACKSGNINTVKKCISHGERRFNIGFDTACMADHLEIVQIIIGCPERNNNNFIWNEAFYSACKYGCFDIVRFMIKQITRYGRLDFMFGIDDGFYVACKNGDIKIVQLIISLGITQKIWNMGFRGVCEGNDSNIDEHKKIIQILFYTYY